MLSEARSINIHFGRQLVLIHTAVTAQWYWYPLVPTGTYWYPLIPTGTNWFPPVPTSTHCYPLVHIGAHWYILVSTGTHRGCHQLNSHLVQAGILQPCARPRALQGEGAAVVFLAKVKIFLQKWKYVFMSGLYVFKVQLKLKGLSEPGFKHTDCLLVQGVSTLIQGCTNACMLCWGNI